MIGCGIGPTSRHAARWAQLPLIIYSDILVLAYSVFFMPTTLAMARRTRDSNRKASGVRPYVVALNGSVVQPESFLI